MTTLNLIKKSCLKASILVAAAIGTFALSSHATSPIFTDQFGGYGTSDGDKITENGSLGFGWYVRNPAQEGSDVNDAVIDTTRFSPIPFSLPGNTQSVRLRRDFNTGTGDSVPRLINYFSNRITGSSTSVTGSLGGNLTGSGISFSFDINSRFLQNQRVEFYSNTGQRAFGLEKRFDTPLRYFADTTVILDTSEWAFQNNTWYRFSFDNVDIDAGTWDFTVSRWNTSTESFDATISRTGLAFENAVSNLGEMHIYHNAEGTNGGTNIDNFSVIPEPATIGLLFGLGIFGFILWRRRKA